ncbi:serine--tRNA ligase [Neolewinella lacunae]|uniref:Serine--tRNA ligase n=1 Tax=Neolewinella lacunae TaxID=1517758 RepID=A0A923PPP0_9BACT|nr:serine--tRNA ligase [Neolewinella lacunae]MBC6996275.1 serine--tRNA ligase [Neolewinella lacunae]MDN3636898.1 serine--tRNA ligase [Neolewinella lacunae]
MLLLTTLRQEKATVLAGLAKRNLSNAEAIIDRVIALDDRRKELQTANDALLAERNKLSDEIGDLFKSGRKDEATAKRERVNAIKDEVAAGESDYAAVVAELEAQLVQLPNVPHALVPAGKDAEDNEVFRPHPGPLPTLGPDAKPHWELATTYGIFDLDLGVRTTGSGFPVFTGQGARLARSLVNLFLDYNTAAGYTEYQPPLLVNEDTARATGQLPDKEGQMYYVTQDDLYLIPTAEVPLTNLYRGEIVSPEQLPIQLTGYTPCFRREAGSYGAHVRGLNRVHQFDKVEIVEIVQPETSYDRLHAMVEHVAGLLTALGLPFRILRLCGGDMGFTSAMTFDFEVWSAAQERWLEVSSVSNFETFQSNRLKLRYRSENGIQLTHTLNGSALALPRIIAALLENNQTPAGILMPAILQPYLGKEMLLPV